jgi:hypothetical protein
MQPPSFTLGGGIMSRYKYLELNYDHNMIQIFATDYITLDWVVREIEKIVPSCKVYKEAGYNRIDELKGIEKKIGAWVIQILCKQGWEPWAGTGPLDGARWHYLRYRYDTGDLSPLDK